MQPVRAAFSDIFLEAISNTSLEYRAIGFINL
jgi:hypothetical protein